MSYSFGMFFKQVKDKGEALDIAFEASRLHYKNVAEVVHNERYYIPSIRSEKDNSSTDRFWLNEIFTLKFVYWEKHKLLGMSGFDFSKEVEDLFDCHVHFQNSCDQNYEFDTWNHKINLFREYKVRYVSMPVEEIQTRLDDDDYTKEELQEMADYYRRSLFYSFIYEELHLNNWLWDNEDRTFLRFAINALDSQEKKSDAYRYVMKEVNNYKENPDSFF